MIDKEEMRNDILFQIDMQLYDEFNDKFCEINEHFGDVYTYKDLRDIEEAQTEKERTLLRGAVSKLQNRIIELEEINEEHQKLNGELQKKLTKLKKENKRLNEIIEGKTIQGLGMSNLYGGARDEH